MDLVKLIVENFGPIKEATLYLQDKGLVAVNGINLDSDSSNSNGSGKSSLINAILWCNYGDLGKKAKSVDGVINATYGKDCAVHCEWHHNGSKYLISRFRKHNKFSNAIVVQGFNNELDEWSDITKAGKEQEQINAILGSDLNTFQASCFAIQEKALDIPALTDKGLKELLENSLPFEDLSEYHTKACHERNAINNEHHNLVLYLEKLEYGLELIKNQGKAAKEARDNWGHKLAIEAQALRDRINELDIEISSLEETKPNIDLIQKAFDKFHAEVSAYDDTERQSVSNEVYNSAKNKSDFKRQIDDIDSLVNCGSCGQSIGDRAAVLKTLNQNFTEASIKYEAAVKKLTPLEEAYKASRTASERLQKARQMLDEAKAHEGRIASLRALKSSLDNQTQDDSNPHVETVNRLAAEYKNTKASIDALKVKIEEVKAELEEAEEVVKVFSPQGVRYHMLEEVTPRLNERTNYYLHQLTDGAISANWSTVTKLKSGDYREKFSITIKYGKIEDYGLISGGEKRKVRLACFFALQDMIAERAEKPINIWCGDEIDHALDDAGLERLMGILNEKTETKSTILVISHSDLSAWIPNGVVVTKENEVSTVTGYLNE